MVAAAGIVRLNVNLPRDELGGIRERRGCVRAGFVRLNVNLPRDELGGIRVRWTVVVPVWLG